MNLEECTLSDKVKAFLARKLIESQNKIKKCKRKRKIIKILYYTLILLSIMTSGIVVTLTSFVGVSPIIIAILSTFSGLLTGISAKFNFENKKVEINKLIDKLSKLQAKIDYVVSCNGDLTKDEYQAILSEFNL
jgi:uncharacterized membrane protein